MGRSSRRSTISNCATIYVAFGEYAESLSIDRDVTIVGVNEPTVRGLEEQDVLNIASGTTTLRNISLLGPGGPQQSGRVVVNLGELVMESGDIGPAYLYDPDICRGAAIYSEGPVTLRDVDVSGQLFAQAEGAQCRGAAIYISGAALWLEDTILWEGVITLDGSGGLVDGSAIYAEASDVRIVGGGVFDGLVYADVNDASGSTVRGQSIYAVDSTLRIEDSYFTAGHWNLADSVLGASIYARNTSVEIVDSYLGRSTWGAVEQVLGGLVYVMATEDVTVHVERSFLSPEVTFDGEPANPTVMGGAFYVDARDGAQVAVTIVNTGMRPRLEALPAATGGAFRLRADNDASIRLDIASSTIFGANVGAGEGGVLATSSTHGGEIEIAVRNTIMWNSQAALGVDCSTPGAVLESDAYSMFSAPGSCPGASGIEGVDPLLDVNNYTYMELRPTPESPAIDAGDPAGCFDADGVLLDVDQLGLPRHVNGVCDVGAIERQD